MDVILKQALSGIEKAGAVIKVKDGFARNYLLPRNLAVAATPDNLKKLEQERQSKLKQLEKTKKEAEALKKKLESLSLTIPVLTQEKDELYGSITSVGVAAALKEEGLDIDKNLIIVDEPIKSLGIYEIPVNLSPEITARIKIWVVKK